MNLVLILWLMLVGALTALVLVLSKEGHKAAVSVFGTFAVLGLLGWAVLVFKDPSSLWWSLVFGLVALVIVRQAANEALR